MAMALIGIIVQPATARLYGRLHGGLLERADDIVAMCWRALSYGLRYERTRHVRSRRSDC